MSAKDKDSNSQSLSIDYVRNWVKPRVSAKRFEHIAGVADVACRLASKVGSDQYLSQLAAWLHDACKEVNNKELIVQAKEFGLALDPIEEENGHLLHGPVAACLVKRELGIDNEDVLKAIAEHTLGASPMCLLSKVIFLADALEPGRPEEYTKPIWQALGSLDQEKLDLDHAILVTCNLNLKFLQDSGKAIHPRTVAVRNYYLDLHTRLLR